MVRQVTDPAASGLPHLHRAAVRAVPTSRLLPGSPGGGGCPAYEAVFPGLVQRQWQDDHPLVVVGEPPRRTVAGGEDSLANLLITSLRIWRSGTRVTRDQGVRSATM